MSFKEISYPVYLLQLNKPNIEEGKSYYYYEKRGPEGELIRSRTLVIDNKDTKGTTLAQRRLRLAAQGEDLFRLRRAVFFPGDLIKASGNNKQRWFVDNTGRVFQYKTSAWSKLKSYYITNQTPIPTGGTLLEVQGVGTRFKTLGNPDYNNKYAILAEPEGGGLLLYGLSPIYIEEIRKRI